VQEDGHGLQDMHDLVVAGPAGSFGLRFIDGVDKESGGPQRPEDCR